MSTGPGPTRKADGSEASVDDIADLLVEGESHQGRTEGEQSLGEQSLDDGLDVMLETPGPALVSTFMPPPPSPVADDAEENESTEEPGESTNLAYEDLLAKLVLPAKAPEPEPAMPALAAPLPMPETLMAPALPTPPAVAFSRPSSASFQIASPTEERTLVTVNPLVAEEQEAAYREGRTGSREQPPVVYEELPAMTGPAVGASTVVVRSRAFYLTASVVLVLFGFFLAVVFLKAIGPTPVPQAPVVITPAPPPPVPPAHVEPLPPSPAPAPAAAQPEAVAPAPPAPENTAPTVEEAPPAQPKVHKAATRKVAHPAAPKTAPAPKAAPAPAPAAKASKTSTGKKKAGGYADPFDN